MTVLQKKHDSKWVWHHLSYGVGVWVSRSGGLDLLTRAIGHLVEPLDCWDHTLWHVNLQNHTIAILLPTGDFQRGAVSYSVCDFDIFPVLPGLWLKNRRTWEYVPAAVDFQVECQLLKLIFKYPTLLFIQVKYSNIGFDSCQKFKYWSETANGWVSVILLSPKFLFSAPHRDYKNALWSGCGEAGYTNIDFDSSRTTYKCHFPTSLMKSR